MRVLIGSTKLSACPSAQLMAKRLARLLQVLATGANDVYVVRTEAPFNQGRDLLLPAIVDVVQHVDIAAGEMIVDLPPGLVEESPES